MFADCFCAVHTQQLEFANFSLPREGRLKETNWAWLKLPCIRLAHGKFELANQDSGGGENFSVLQVNRKGDEIR